MTSASRSMANRGASGLLAVHGEREGLLANDVAGDLVDVTAADPDVKYAWFTRDLSAIQDRTNASPRAGAVGPARVRSPDSRTAPEPVGVPRAAPDRDRAAHDVRGHVVR